jgi:hypothetical protein
VLEIYIPKPERKTPKTVQINLGTHADSETIDRGGVQANHNEPVSA